MGKRCVLVGTTYEYVSLLSKMVIKLVGPTENHQSRLSLWPARDSTTRQVKYFCLWLGVRQKQKHPDQEYSQGSRV